MHACMHTWIHTQSYSRVAIIGQATGTDAIGTVLLFLRGEKTQISFISDQRIQEDQPTNSSMQVRAFQSE